ncbi:MAG TPA: hypothetical protein VII08_17555 [Myxococcales bacterium]
MSANPNGDSPNDAPGPAAQQGSSHTTEEDQSAYSRAFIEATKRIGRKQLVHALQDPEAREYLGFGIVEARETVERAIAESEGSPQAWLSLKAEVIATLAEMPPATRARKQAAKMLFGLWVEMLERAKKDGLDETEARAHCSPKVIARMIMKSLLPEEEAKKYPDQPPPETVRTPARPKIPLLAPNEYDLLRGIYDAGGPIKHSGRAGFFLLMMTAKGAGEMCEHPDGIVQAVGHLLGDIGRLLIRYDPRTLESQLDHPSDTKAESEKSLRALLLAAEKAGLRVAYGPFGGIPNASDPAWCARAVRIALAEIDFLDLPAYAEWPAEPAIADDPEAIARAFAGRWADITNRPPPVTGSPAVTAIRDMLARVDSEWVSFDRLEKARQVVMTCMRLAGHKKPSAFFDADRKKAERSELREKRGRNSADE